MSLQQHIDHYRQILLDNLNNYPAFDLSAPYEQKNAYFLDIFQASTGMFGYDGLVSAAEKYYRAMLDTILDFEQRHNKAFNKGIVYANLGLILITHDNLDEGVHYLLLADKEDSSFRVDPHGILESPLWKQFEDRHVVAHLIALNNDPNAALQFRVDEAFLLGFLRTIELSDRLLFEATVWTIFRNLNFNPVNFNDYTRGRLYSGLKDLCLLAETLLRKKQVATGIVAPNTQVMLSRLLTNALQAISVTYPPNPNLPVGANSLNVFIGNLEQILQTNHSPEVKRIACLHLVRNFTGHHFDVSSQVVSTTGKGLFDLYREVLTHILSAILYLAQAAQI